MKRLVEVLVQKKLSPQTIKNILGVVKLVKSSATDENGNELYPTKWNNEFMDVPVVVETKQRKPSCAASQVSEIVNATGGRIQMIVILLAPTGLRTGELFGLEVRTLLEDTLVVEQEVWEGRVQAPKTPNAVRVVDLHPDVASLLRQFIGSRETGFIFQTTTGRPLSRTNLLRRELHPVLNALGISKRGFHAFRRFRNTYLRRSACPDGLLKFWMGHAGRDMSDRYDRIREDEISRRDVARSIGLGFELPQALAPKRPNAGDMGAIGHREEGAQKVRCQETVLTIVDKLG